MSEMRRFTESEVITAKNCLTILAHESANYWANALVSEDFMHQGKVWYRTSKFHKSDRGYDEPNPDAIPISGEQIINFYNAYLGSCIRAINQLIEDDRVVAAILFDKKNVIPEEESFGEFAFSFGGWDNDPDGPEGELAKAMEESGIEGAMRVSSGFRKSYVGLKDGVIFLSNFGFKGTVMEVYKP